MAAWEMSYGLLAYQTGCEERKEERRRAERVSSSVNLRVCLRLLGRPEYKQSSRAISVECKGYIVKRTLPPRVKAINCIHMMCYYYSNIINITAEPGLSFCSIHTHPIEGVSKDGGQVTILQQTDLWSDYEDCIGLKKEFYDSTWFLVTLISVWRDQFLTCQVKTRGITFWRMFGAVIWWQ